MITIRLFRIGKKRQPSYKIVVTDKKNSPTGGRFIDEVGFYNPITKERSVNGDKVKYWISKGASVSDTVHNLLVTEGVIEAKKRPQHGLPEKKEGEDEVATEVKKEETPKIETEEAPKIEEEKASEVKTEEAPKVEEEVKEEETKTEEKDAEVETAPEKEIVSEDEKSK